MVNFVLDYLSSSVAMDVSGVVYSQSITGVDASATAVFHVSLDDMKNVFQFQTNSNFDIADLPADIKYKIDTASWPSLNPANGMMDDVLSLSPIITGDSTGAYPSNVMMVAHDFVRYLALKLFNSAYGAELFDNQLILLNDIRKICGSDSSGQTWHDIVEKLNTVGINGTHADLEGSAAHKYMTDNTTGEANLCRTLFQQLTGSVIDRFANIQGGDDFQPLPLEADDSISFKLTVDAAPGQHNLTEVDPIVPRSYEIKLVFVSGTPSNTEVAADEPYTAP
jgi:hypothetical protein